MLAANGIADRVECDDDRFPAGFDLAFVDVSDDVSAGGCESLTTIHYRSTPTD
jgi:hypothetical protein